MQRIELLKDERFTLTLPGRAAAGYRWSFTVDDPRPVLVEPVKLERPPAAPQPPSYSLDEQFILTAREPGETVVRFRQTRSFEPSKPPLAAHDVLVVVRPPS